MTPLPVPPPTLERSRSSMYALVTERPAVGLDPATCISVTLRESVKRRLLNDALELGLTLEMNGHSIRLFLAGSEIVMDGLTPIQANVPPNPEGNSVFTAEEDWIGLAFTIVPAATGGCGVGYVGLGWNREEVISTLLKSWTELDFVVLGSTVALSNIRRSGG